jgi:hypothetical protein
MELDAPKKTCPFQINYRCHAKCEWFDLEQNRCVIWSFYRDVSDFVKVIRDYISLQLKIKNIKDNE